MPGCAFGADPTMDRSCNLTICCSATLPPLTSPELLPTPLQPAWHCRSISALRRIGASALHCGRSYTCSGPPDLDVAFETRKTGKQPQLHGSHGIGRRWSRLIAAGFGPSDPHPMPIRLSSRTVRIGSLRTATCSSSCGRASRLPTTRHEQVPLGASPCGSPPMPCFRSPQAGDGLRFEELKDYYHDQYRNPHRPHRPRSRHPRDQGRHQRPGITVVTDRPAATRTARPTRTRTAIPPRKASSTG